MRGGTSVGYRFCVVWQVLAVMRGSLICLPLGLK